MYRAINIPMVANPTQAITINTAENKIQYIMISITRFYLGKMSVMTSDFVHEDQATSKCKTVDACNQSTVEESFVVQILTVICDIIIIYYYKITMDLNY